MTVDDFLEAQRDNIESIERDIGELLAEHGFYSGMRRTWLKNGLIWLERFNERLEEDVRDSLRDYVQRGFTHARALFTMFSYDDTGKYGTKIKRMDRSYLLADYMRLGKQYDHSVRTLPDGEQLEA